MGSRRIGVAVSDPLGITAQGLPTIHRQNKRLDYAQLENVIREYEVVAIVVGLPLRMSGQEGIQSERMRQFAEDLRKRFKLPVLSLIDTAGAYPGVDAEARGQAEAIARSIETCLGLHVPVVAAVIGEGGSGGAIAIATANRVLMLEHAIYSVISPEGAASILWHDTAKAQEAATNMKITADDLMRFGVIDEIVPEPVGGAHRDPAAAIAATGAAVSNALMELGSLDREAVRKQRRQKFLNIGRSL